MSPDTIDPTTFGGKPIAYGDPNEPAWDFGWRWPAERTPQEVAVNAADLEAMPEFRVSGSWNDDEEKVFLWDFAKAANGGQHFLVFWQQTGSCVGNGGGQATWYLSAVEVVRLKDPEQVILPFYLLPYGKSRQHAGMRGRGSGSFGSAFAQAIREDGILPYNTPGLPQPQTDPDKGITWGSRTELEWSDGAAIDDKWLALSRKHLVKTTAQCKTADACWEALSNYYPLTIASDWGGQMKCQVQSDPPVLLNKRSGTWMHQMSVIGRWRHPKLGKMFYVLNSWGPRTHGECPSGAPPGGFWIAEADMNNIARQGDTFAFSQFNGFPAQKFSWTV